MVTGKVPATNIQTAQQSARIAVEFIPAFPPVSVDGWCAAWRGPLHDGLGRPL
jgi:hypothetical protein